MTPWQGDACSLVEAFRAGRALAGRGAAPRCTRRSTPAISTRSASRRRERRRGGRRARRRRASRSAACRSASRSSTTSPAGRTPTPRCRCATTSATRHVDAWSSGSAAPAARCSPGRRRRSEFGGVNVTRTVLHGTTHNPWQHGTTPGGSVGRIGGGGRRRPRHARHRRRRRRLDPHPGRVLRPVRAEGDVRPDPDGARTPSYGNLTVTIGCLSRSVRDTARWFDVANGHDPTRPAEPAARRRVGGRRSAPTSTSCAACASPSSPTGATRSCRR